MRASKLASKRFLVFSYGFSLSAASYLRVFSNMMLNLEETLTTKIERRLEARVEARIEARIDDRE